LQFLIYFERIANSERLINVQAVKFSTLQEKQKGRFQMLNMSAVLEGFRYNSSYREDTGIDKIEEQFKEGGETGGGKKRRRKRGGGE
jgi:hypothetical protein